MGKKAVNLHEYNQAQRQLNTCRVPDCRNWSGRPGHGFCEPCFRANKQVRKYEQQQPTRDYR